MITSERLLVRPYVPDDLAAIEIDETRRRVDSYIALHEQTGTSSRASGVLRCG